MVHESTLRPRLLEWAQTALLAANLAWTTLCLGGYLAQTMVVTSALTGALVFVHALSGLAARPVLRRPGEAGPSSAAVLAPPRVHAAGWLFLPFLAYAAWNVLFVTPVRWLGWFDWFGWAQTIAVFWVVLNGIRSRAAQRAVWATLFGVAGVGVLFGCYQAFVRPDWLIMHRIQAAQYIGRASGPFGIPNSFAGLLVLLIPTAGALAFRRRAGATARVFFGWLALVLLLGLGLTISRGGWLALAIALTTWPLLAGFVDRGRFAGAAGGPKPAGSGWGRRLLGSAAAFGGIVLAAAATYLASPAVRERLTQFAHDMGERSRPIMWRAAWHLAREHPWVGSGAGSFDTEFERFRPEGFLNRPYWAHNDYLNVLSDFGAIGLVLLFGAAAFVVWRCVRGVRADSGDRLDRTSRRWPPGRPPLPQASLEGGAGSSSSVRSSHRRRDPLADPLVRQAQAIGLLAFALQLLVEFHLEMPALALTFATVSALTVQRAWPAAVNTSMLDVECSMLDVREARLRFATPTLCVSVLPVLLAVAALAFAAYVVPAYRAEALRQTARGDIDALADTPVSSVRYRERIGDARARLDRAVALAPANAQAWADRAYATAQAARLAPAQEKQLGAEAERDADQALQRDPLCAEYWIRRGVARDLQGRWDQAGADFAHAITLSPKLPLPWFHYAYHLALRRPGLAMAEAMVAFCLRLDPKNPDALRLRQQLATGRPAP